MDTPTVEAKEMPPAPKPARLFTFSSGGWVLLLSFILCILTAAGVLWPVWQTGMHAAVGDGKNIDTYGFDLANLSIPRATLVAPGVSKDQIRAIPVGLEETITPAEVELRNQNEREQGRFLVASDRIIGVDINGESRAYPLRVMSYHEVANDVIGGVPIAVTYNPLCDSAVVFDRRIDGSDSKSGDAVEMGVSGLLANSNLVMFDRRPGAKGESLWPQLAMKAVSGPLLEKRLSVVDSQLTTWRHWKELHPATRVVQGLRTLKDMYKAEPFNTYLASDEVKFPVAPLWDKGGLEKKTKIVAVSVDGGKTWRVERPGNEDATAPAATATAAAEIRIHTFLFAWYAQHPSDTDYAALLTAK